MECNWDTVSGYRNDRDPRTDSRHHVLPIADTFPFPLPFPFLAIRAAQRAACSRTQSGDSVEHDSTSSRTQSGDAGGHAGETVTISVGRTADGLFIEDNGPGIPEEIRSEVFDHGYSTDEEGTGFGLSIASQIADGHGWTISVTEGSEGGARFEIGL